MGKTCFLHISKHPLKQSIQLYDDEFIQYAEKDRHFYLGMWTTSYYDITDHIKCNLLHRKYNIAKVYHWLEINDHTPIKIKLQVLDCCMFASYLYGCECQWKIDVVADALLVEERQILKRLLRVKPNTTNDIVYI